MRRSTILFAAATAVVLSACGSGELVVTAAVEVDDPTEEGATQVMPLSDVEVEIIPFDRDAVFDSLAQAAGTPEPEIPEDVLVAQDSIAEAQGRWQAMQTRWNTLRDTLQTISRQMERYNRGEARYVALFREFQELEGQYNRVERQVDQAFARFDSIQKANIERANEIRIQRENWADEAFAGVGEVYAAKVRASGLKMHVDTTDAQGITRFQALKPGQYWVHARFELPFTELYWNVPVEVPRGEPFTLELTRANAEERPKL